jgi:hypothetical protein
MPAARYHEEKEGRGAIGATFWFREVFMRTLHGGRWAAPLAVLLLAGAAGRAGEGVSVKVVKYDGLGETIKQLKGKVVVADFWADT